MLSLEDITATFNEAPPPRNMPTITPCYFVHENDNPVVQYVINPQKNGPWVAGGSCLAWYQHKSCFSDIDVYFKNEKQYDRLTKELLQNLSDIGLIISNIYKTENAVTYKIKSRDTGKSMPAIQFIKKNWFQNPQEVINSFDITVCQIAWDGHRIIYNNSFVDDEKNRVLRFSSISPSSHRRLVKYMCYGYWPHDGCIEQLVQDSNIDWNSSTFEDYS